MLVRRLTDLPAVASLLGRQPARHAYALADLAPPLLERCTFFGGERDAGLCEVVLRYDGLGTSTLIAHACRSDRDLNEVLGVVLDGHSGPMMLQCEAAQLPTVTDRSTVISCIPRVRMVLPAGAALPDPDERVSRLSPPDAVALRLLYEAAYPGSWFDPSLLASGRIVGVWDDDRLLATAGLHALAPSAKVAVLGNITTHPSARRRGLAAACTAALVADLRTDYATIVLNVASDDAGARALYRGLGFVPLFELLELTVVCP